MQCPIEYLKGQSTTAVHIDSTIARNGQRLFLEIWERIENAGYIRNYMKYCQKNLQKKKFLHKSLMKLRMRLKRKRLAT